MNTIEIDKSEKEVIRELQAELEATKYKNRELNDHIAEMRNDKFGTMPTMTEEAMSVIFGLSANDIGILADKIDAKHKDNAFHKILHHAGGKDLILKTYSISGFVQIALMLTHIISNRNKEDFETKVVNSITKKGLLKGFFQKMTGAALDSWMKEDMKSGSFQKAFHSEIEEAQKEVAESEVDSH